MSAGIRWLLPIVLALAVPAQKAHAQGSAPDDFELTVSAGGVEPWSEVWSVHIDSDGEARFMHYIAGDPGAGVLEDAGFTLSGTELARIWNAVESSDFFTLDASYRDPSISGGVFARVLVRANGNTHAVTAENVALQDIDEILAAVNEEVPSGNVLYEPPEQFEVVVRDVCQQPGKAGVRVDPPLLEGIPKLSAEAVQRAGAHLAEKNGEPPHPGTTVAYHMPLQEAVSRGIAQLEGKGGIYGDQVSITVDNGPSHGSDELVMTLYLEFWGSHATAANAQRIEDAIEAAWSGKQTSGGATMKVDVKTRVKPGATAPPGTPGYHQIRLVGETTSFVGDVDKFGINNGTGTGTWETIGVKLDETYAHEAGHLMGFKDKYTAYEKEPDGSWKKEDGSETLTSEQLAEKLQPSNPNTTNDQLKNWLDQPGITRATVPLPGSENDLMADLDGQVLQDYVDALAAQAGLVVEVRPGDILLNKDVDDQNFVITRSEDVFVPHGESRTLEGLYTACIDASKGIPDEGQPFDLTLNLAGWNGVPSATALLQLVRHIDEQELFCELDLLGQLSIWRITDDYPLGDTSMLEEAGVSVEVSFDFPHLTSPNPDDPSSSLSLPLELIVPVITPSRRLAAIGSSVTLSGHVAMPDFDGVSASSSWFLEPPAGSATTLSSQNGQASLTPDRRGFYEVGLNVTLSGWSAEDTTLVALPGARVVAWDQQTDRFERSELGSHSFPWETRGDVPWTVSRDDAHTGGSAAVSGTLVDEQESVLEISFTLPEDGEVAFAFRIASEEFSHEFTFEINGTHVGSWWEASRWGTASFPVPAGDVTLTWTYRLESAFFPGADQVWLDDVFIPAGAVGVSISPGSELPGEARLSQNYPNPFSATTTVDYELPAAQHVTLDVHDLLGRRVLVVVDGQRPAGRHQAVVDARRLPSGVYFYRLRAGDFTEERMMMLAR